MSSIVDNPSELIKCVPFLPKVKFPVYKFNVHNTAWPVRNAAVHFRDLDSLRPPENATENDYVNKYLFRGIPESYSSDSKCCYLLNPIKYPLPNQVISFLQDLHSAHPENTQELLHTTTTIKKVQTILSQSMQSILSFIAISLSLPPKPVPTNSRIH